MSISFPHCEIKRKIIYIYLLDAWCWIKKDNMAISMPLYYLPMFAMLCGITVLYILTIRHLRFKLQTSTLLHTTRSARDKPNKAPSMYANYNRYRILQRELIIYLTCAIFSRIWGIADFLEVVWSQNSGWIGLLYAFFGPLQGFVNTFLFFNQFNQKKNPSISILCKILFQIKTQ